MNKKIKIVDLSTLIPGPFASFILKKELPAEVIKIEDINQPDALANMRPTKDGIGLGYSGINSGKKILKVDMRKDGVERIKHEIKDATVFIENFKIGKAFKMGIGFEDLSKINSNLIYCSISGFPESHPLSKKSAHDLNILSLSGYLDQQLRLGESLALSPMLLADIFTAYHASVKILINMLNHEGGVHLKVSMYEAFLVAMSFNNIPQLQQKNDFYPNDFIMSGAFPCYSVYKTKDGGFVAVAALEKPLWIDFCHHLGHEDWINEQFNIKFTVRIAEEMRKYDRLHWLKDDLDFCVTSVLSINEAYKNGYV